MPKLKFFNDTGREVNIHPATELHGCEADMSPIGPEQTRVFSFPEGTSPFVKLWDHGSKGLQLLVSPEKEPFSMGSFD